MLRQPSFLRIRMLDLKGNFPNKSGLDIACRVCKVQVESQEHILKCDVLILQNLLREREIFMNTEY